MHPKWREIHPLENERVKLLHLDKIIYIGADIKK